MGYSCNGSGMLSIGTAGEAAALEAAKADPQLGPVAARAKTLQDLLRELGLGVDRANDGCGETSNYDVYAHDNWDDDIVGNLDLLARCGLTGQIDYSGEDDAQWKLVLDADGCREINGVVYFPGDTDPDEPCVALTRREVQVLLALVTGDHVDGLDETVAKLAAVVS